MSPSISASLRAWVQQRDAGCCAYCHSPEKLSITPFEVDHIVALHNGGQTIVDNLCLCCPACNRFKSARQMAMDPETGEQAPLFHPRLQMWSDHFRFTDTREILIGLTPTGRATIGALQMNRPALVELRRIWQTLGVSL
jgi:hypothetical protein